MVTEIIRYLITNSQESDFEEAYRKAGEYLLKSSHCSGFELLRSEKEKNRYLLKIEWDSTDGHLEGFRQSEDFKHFFALVKPFFQMIEEMEHYSNTEVKGSK